jgi:hypothetical protein
MGRNGFFGLTPAWQSQLFPGETADDVFHFRAPGKDSVLGRQFVRMGKIQEGRQLDPLFHGTGSDQLGDAHHFYWRLFPLALA